jgi:cyanophycinase
MPVNLLLLLLFAAEPSTGPEQGTLVIVGGGRLPASIAEEFIARAGGIEGPFVLIPTANVGEEWGEAYVRRSFLARRGAKQVAVLHTRDRAVADSESFVAPLRTARGVWIDGGRQWRLADAYLDTLTHRELWNVLKRGGVIGGSSAGATIQGSYLVRGAPEGNHILMAPGHETGWGFLSSTAIDQHVLARHRQLDLYPVVCRHPHLLGLGIDEATAAVVRGRYLRVVGDSVILVHNSQEVPDDPDLPYVTLRPGEVFDLQLRVKVEVSGNQARPATNARGEQHGQKN